MRHFVFGANQEANAETLKNLIFAIVQGFPLAPEDYVNAKAIINDYLEERFTAGCAEIMFFVGIKPHRGDSFGQAGILKFSAIKAEIKENGKPAQDLVYVDVE